MTLRKLPIDSANEREQFKGNEPPPQDVRASAVGCKSLRDIFIEPPAEAGNACIVECLGFYFYAQKYDFRFNVLTEMPEYRVKNETDCSLPRIASFIGTSNQKQLLTDESGSRRFLCIEVVKPIDCTLPDSELWQGIGEGRCPKDSYRPWQCLFCNSGDINDISTKGEKVIRGTCESKG